MTPSLEALRDRGAKEISEETDAALKALGLSKSSVDLGKVYSEGFDAAVKALQGAYSEEQVNELMDKCLEYKRQADKLAEALVFYSKKENYLQNLKYAPEVGPSMLNEFLMEDWAPIVGDLGERAREALGVEGDSAEPRNNIEKL